MTAATNLQLPRQILQLPRQTSRNHCHDKFISQKLEFLTKKSEIFYKILKYWQKISYLFQLCRYELNVPASLSPFVTCSIFFWLMQMMIAGQYVRWRRKLAVSRSSRPRFRIARPQNFANGESSAQSRSRKWSALQTDNSTPASVKCIGKIAGNHFDS